MNHSFRFLIAAEEEIDPATAPAAAGGLVEVSGRDAVRLTMRRGGEDQGVSWEMSVAEFMSGHAMDRDTAAALQAASGPSFGRTFGRFLLYLSVSVAAGLPFHFLHLDVAVAVTVFILLEVAHRGNLPALWRRYFGAGADRSIPAAERWRALRSQAWSAALEEQGLRVDAALIGPDGSETPLGAVASGIGVMRLAGAGLRRQAKLLRLPTFLAGTAFAFAALSVMGWWTLDPSHAVLGLALGALAAGMVGGVRALWRAASRRPSPVGRPAGVSRFVKHDGRPPMVALGAAAVVMAALLAGLSPTLLAGLVALAAIVSLLDLQKSLSGVSRTAGGGHGGWFWELLDLVLAP